ncbi:MAG: hypothetical protein EOM31_02680 [Bacteroidia bacterium]|nr:hypothetical protein [Bacteroidia bacterium]
MLDNRDYKGALEILDRYEDYNTALCLTGLGYNAQAYHVLMELDSTADVEYLFAMLLCRFFKEDLAVEHLLKACRLNPSKIFRISLDPEIADLVEKHKLQGQLDEMMLKDGL